jgi:hypothetical protein
MAAKYRDRKQVESAKVCGLLSKVGFCLVLLAAVEGRLLGQDNVQQRSRVLDEPFRLMMDKDTPVEKRAIFEWGGWLRSSYWMLDENVDRMQGGEVDNDSHGLRLQQLRLWGHANIDQVHQVYARMRFDYLDWNHGSSFGHNDSDWEGPDLERGWYDFRLSRGRAAYGWDDSDFDLSVRLGRQYVELGTGLALSMPLDAVVVDSYYDGWQLTGLGAESIPGTHNIDRSIPGDSEESRRFWGVQLKYNDWRDHEPFAYYFAQDDQDAGMIRNNQMYGYDSRYAGIGSRGRFFHRDLQYTCETVGEWGNSFANGEVANRQNIEAWAFDSELRYVIPDKHQSQLSTEYMWCSGDPDRQMSPTNTVGGNELHTTDEGFVAWGYRNTGLVLAPQMSNLGMVRLGTSTFPVNQASSLKRLRVGADYFLFHKNNASAAASDNLSVKDHNYLGSEFNFYANWQLTSDLALMAQYGIFLPGEAFSDQTYRESLFTGVTLSF